MRDFREHWPAEYFIEEIGRNPSPLRKFDVFRGQYLDKDAVWIEAVEGLGAARGRMQQIASEEPGLYFLFTAHNRQVLAVLDTRKSASPNEKRESKAG